MNAPLPSDTVAEAKQQKRSKHRFVKMTYDGTSCIVFPHEVNGMLDGNDPSDYVLTDVWMTAAQYEALPEFEGW